MTDTGEPSTAAVKTDGSLAEQDRAAPPAEGRRRLELYAVAALVAVATAALGTVALVGGDGDGDDWLGSFALMLVPPLIGVVVALAFGRRLIDRMPPVAGPDRKTRYRVKIALRDGHTDDPQVDAAARDEAGRILARRWLPLLPATALLVQLGVAVVGDDLPTRAVHALGVVGWAVVILLHQRARRQARRYLAP